MTSAVVIQHSVSAETLKEIVTFEVTFHRYILSEFNTHRMFSRNGASSRAIPLKRMIELVRENTATPCYWGKNRPGMSAIEEIEDIAAAKHAWQQAAENAISSALELEQLGVHKQVANRLLEPFMYQKMLVTATDFENWFWLRDHEDAQPEIRDLARAMKLALEQSRPMVIKHGQWHVPYVERTIDRSGKMHYYDETGAEISLEQALKISASCAAQVSYRRNDTSLEKAEDIFDRLIRAEPQHFSPLEHQATPIGRMEQNEDSYEFGTNGLCMDEEMVTHYSYNESQEVCFHSGNFKDWLQYRQAIASRIKNQIMI